MEVECSIGHGLLYDLTHTISGSRLDIASAHIATFGERVVDTFYVTDLVGHKIAAKAKTRQNRIRKDLLAAIGPATEEAKTQEVTSRKRAEAKDV